MKLYATIENSKGKVVSLADNNCLTATVYDGNMKAYSVIIEWTIVGEPEYIKCDKCNNDFSDIEIYENNNLCTNCGKEGKLREIPAEMGAIVTTREWRNRLQINDRLKVRGKKCNHHLCDFKAQRTAE